MKTPIVSRLSILVVLLMLSLGSYGQSITPGTFYKHLRGNINKTLSITMDLHYNGDVFTGSYYYDSKRQPISISGKYEGAELVISETVEGETTGTFKGKFVSTNLFSGTWWNKDKSKSFPFALVEDYSKGSAPLVFTGITDKMFMFDNRKGSEDPAYVISNYILYPDASQGGIASKMLHEYVDSVLGPDVNEAEPVSGIIASCKVGFEDYRTMQEEVDADNAFSFSWSQESAMDVVLNDNQILTVSSNGYEYTGGAHGNYYTVYNNFDLVTGRQITEADIFKPGYMTSLIPLLEGKYRVQYELKPDEILSDYLFVEHIEPNGNFYLTPQGLGYVYNIYEIHAYVMGAADLFMTWEELGPFMKADSPLIRLVNARQ